MLRSRNRTETRNTSILASHISNYALEKVSTQAYRRRYIAPRYCYDRPTNSFVECTIYCDVVETSAHGGKQKQEVDRNGRQPLAA